MVRRFYTSGVTELNGHLLYALPEAEYAVADAWLERHGITAAVTEPLPPGRTAASIPWTRSSTGSSRKFVEAWQDDAGLETTGTPSPNC